MIQIPEKLGFMLKPKRIKVAYGGRGGAKTVSFVKIAIHLAKLSPVKFLCLRQFMNSIDDSVHSELEEEINRQGLQDFFTVNRSSIDGINGSQFRYSQLDRNIQSLKSKSKFDVAWVEEAATVTEKSLDFLLPTIRKSGSELWFSFNPEDEFQAVYAEFVKPHLAEIAEYGYFESDELYVCKIGLDDNPFAPAELKQHSEQMKRENYRKWVHVYGGECEADYEDSIISPEWVQASIDAHIKLGFRPQGVISTGFDPADTGSDNKATVTRWGNVVVDAHSWTDGGIEEAVDRAFSYAFDQRSDHIVYDAVGIGASVKMGLDERIYGKRIKVDAFQGGASPDIPDARYKNDRTNKDTFANKRAQYWWYLRDRFEATYLAVNSMKYTDPSELISISSDLSKERIAQLKSELTRVQRKRTGRGNDTIMLESKADMKKRNMKSPGMADALVYSFANSLPFSEEAAPQELIPDYTEDY